MDGTLEAKLVDIVTFLDLFDLIIFQAGKLQRQYILRESLVYVFNSTELFVGHYPYSNNT